MVNMPRFILLLALLSFPSLLLGQQESISSNHSIQPANSVENWKVLGDLDSGLKYQVPFLMQKDDMPEFSRELLRAQWRSGDPIDLYVMRPNKSGKVPAIIYLYSYPGDSDPFLNNEWCKRVTQNGFAAVGFVSALTGQRYRGRPMKEWFVSELQESLGSTVHDVQMILNYLSAREDVDMDHVGMIGQGSGASIAILAAQADPRIRALDLLDPWGDWKDWLQESPAITDADRPKFTTPDFLQSVSTLDPTSYLPNLKVPSIRLQQILTDPVTPKSAKDRIAAVVPKQTQLVRYESIEEHRKAWQTCGLSCWIKERLQPQPKVEAAKHLP